tara:strand:+ start:1289 stop:2182 length:894 start_codon:yes stop_codon:yes gene_type:complete
MPGRKRVPSFQLPSGTTDERDGSYNLTTVGSIFYNTDTSNVEIRHVDPNNSVDWRDLMVNNKEQIDITGKLVVKDDVSFNAHLSVLDASFQNDVTVVGNITFSDSSVQFTSSPILEYISHYCDGTQINIKNKDYNNGKVTIEDCQGAQYFGGGYTKMNGSYINYCPPQGTTLLIYEFNFCSRAHENHKIALFRLEIRDPNVSTGWWSVTNSNFGNTEYGHPSTSDSHSVKVPITIETNGEANSSSDIQNGKLKNYNSSLEFRVTARGWSSGHDWTAYQTVYAGTFFRPKITLIAIKQ